MNSKGNPSEIIKALSRLIQQIIAAGFDVPHNIFVTMESSKEVSLVIASDHAGYDLKKELLEYLVGKGFNVQDAGTDSNDRTDYPDHAHRAASMVQDGDADTGILICGSGNGVNMSANKHPGIRSALAWNPEIAALGKQHNNANMLAIPARFVSFEEAREIVDAFLGAHFEGGRHEARVNKIDPQHEPTEKAWPVRLRSS